MTSTIEAPDLLAAIVGATRHMVDVRASQIPLDELDRRAASVEPRPGFFKEALSRTDRLNVIAECKRRSPSRGVLKANYDPGVDRARYERAGAAAISVLTEPAFFDGHLDHLVAARRVTSYRYYARTSSSIGTRYSKRALPGQNAILRLWWP